MHSYFRTHITIQPIYRPILKYLVQYKLSCYYTRFELVQFLNVVLRALEILILILFQNRGLFFKFSEQK